jgi:hypothetical protein
LVDEIQSLRRELEQRKGKKSHLLTSIEVLQNRLKEKERDLCNHEKAREIIRKVGQMTQEQLRFRMSEIPTLALNSVFDDPYELVVDFVPRRNRTECDLKFTRANWKGDVIDPIDNSGGGPIDVAAFALRVASLTMQRPRKRMTLILDEPGKMIKGEKANRRFLSMIQEVSRRLKLQVIMVSDERIDRADIVAHADRVFEVTKVGGKSLIQIGG